MANPFIDGIASLFKSLGLSSEQLQNIKLGPGVVGRNTRMGHTFLLVALAGVFGGVYIKSAMIIGISLIAAFLIAAGIPILNVIFGNKNPAAAILEGAEFLQYQQIEMAAKGIPAIVPTLPPETKPQELSGEVDKTTGGDA